MDGLWFGKIVENLCYKLKVNQKKPTSLYESDTKSLQIKTNLDNTTKENTPDKH